MNNISLVGLVLFAFVMGVITTQALYKMDILFEQYEPIELHWACMDGCYNMLIVEYGDEYGMSFDDTYDESRLQHLHEHCSDICWNMTMAKEKH